MMKLRRRRSLAMKLRWQRHEMHTKFGDEMRTKFGYEAGTDRIAGKNRKDGMQYVHLYGSKKNIFHMLEINSRELVLVMIIIFWEMTPCGSYKSRRFRGSS
jgi:hypothetical protein